ncbi:MAG: hypothetical protein K9I68_08290 [Bacteroidales bacterium]|nr:hypothetical protein [Bacteroidales bacterium]MCF8338079.1 hypothetical protein [Bacteroidales bacterium]
MKKYLILLMLPAFLLGSCSIFKSGTSEKSFEGKVKYDITYPESSISEAQRQQLPSSITLYLKGDKVMTEMITGMFTRKTIKDVEQKKTTTLLEVMGQKYAIEKSEEEIKKQLEEKGEPEVNITDETKEIAGYTCQKAVVKPENGDKNNVYFTSEIGSSKMNFDSPTYRKINGLPLDYEMKTDMFTMKLTATEVEKTDVSDDNFKISDDYKKVSEEELQNILGQ